LHNRFELIQKLFTLDDIEGHYAHRENAHRYTTMRLLELTTEIWKR